MTDLVAVRKGKGKSSQISLAEIQDRLDARQQVAETRTVVSTKKARIEQAKQNFNINPLATVDEIHDLAGQMAVVFDDKINLDTVPLRQDEINNLSDEFLLLEQMRARLDALETRYRTLVFEHLNQTVKSVPGRPASQMPGKVEAEGPGPRYIFERRGGNRSNPDLNTEGLRAVLPDHLAAQIFVTVTYPAMEARTEQVFDQTKFGELVDSGEIDLDVVAKHLTPGDWRTPSFYKTLVGGE